MALPSEMKAIQWNVSENSVKLITLSTPSDPADTHVVIKVAYSGVCGTDLHAIEKEFPTADKVILGHEFAGTVVATGSKVVALKVGDHVAVNPNSGCGNCRFCTRGQYHICMHGGLRSTIGLFRDGGWSEYCEVPEQQAIVTPDSLAAAHAPLCEPLSCVINGYNRLGQIRNDAQILVTGAGIIGLLWTSLLHHHGYGDVSICDIAEGRRLLAKNLGFGYRVCTTDDLEEQFRDCEADEEGFDVIVDCTGSPASIQQAVKYLRRGGTLNIFGCCPKKSSVTMNPFEIFHRELTIVGSLINPFTFPSSISLANHMSHKYLSYEQLGIREYRLGDHAVAVQDLKNGIISKAMFKIGGDW